MVARLLEQDSVLRPRGAIGDRRPGGGQLNAGAIDEPRARGVHALKLGEIEDRALRAFGQRKGAKPPPSRVRAPRLRSSPGQGQNGRILADLSSYGRDRGHQALRPSTTALISRSARPVEPTPARRPGAPPGRRIRAKTNRVRIGDPPQGLKFANKASSISARTGARAFRNALRREPFPFPLRLNASQDRRST